MSLFCTCLTGRQGCKQVFILIVLLIVCCVCFICRHTCCTKQIICLVHQTYNSTLDSESEQTAVIEWQWCVMPVTATPTTGINCNHSAAADCPTHSAATVSGQQPIAVGLENRKLRGNYEEYKADIRHDVNVEGELGASFVF